MADRNYWDSDGQNKTFAHDIYGEWLTGIDRSYSVLDLGCGYGRLTKTLTQSGFNNITGFDTSTRMIDRARRENPGIRYLNNSAALGSNRFDLVICFAVFTSNPAPEDQAGLVSFINDHTHQTSLLYISDYETADNPHYTPRYKQNKLDTYGCFESSKSVFRHHAPGHFSELFDNWKKINERTADSITMNGNSITIHQYLYEKTGD